VGNTKSDCRRPGRAPNVVLRRRCNAVLRGRTSGRRPASTAWLLLRVLIDWNDPTAQHPADRSQKQKIAVAPPLPSTCWRRPAHGTCSAPAQGVPTSTFERAKADKRLHGGGGVVGTATVKGRAGRMVAVHSVNTGPIRGVGGACAGTKFRRRCGRSQSCSCARGEHMLP